MFVRRTQSNSNFCIQLSIKPHTLVTLYIELVVSQILVNSYFTVN